MTGLIKTKKEVRILFKSNGNTDFTKLKKQIIELFSNRLVIVGALALILFGIIIYRIFVLQIVQGEEHQSNFNYKVEKTIETSGSRGNIYDCNGKLLAYNQLAYTVTLENTDKTKKIAKEKVLMRIP